MRNKIIQVIATVVLGVIFTQGVSYVQEKRIVEKAVERLFPEAYSELNLPPKVLLLRGSKVQTRVAWPTTITFLPPIPPLDTVKVANPENAH